MVFALPAVGGPGDQADGFAEEKIRRRIDAPGDIVLDDDFLSLDVFDGAGAEHAEVGAVEPGP